MAADTCSQHSNLRLMHRIHQIDRVSSSKGQHSAIRLCTHRHAYAQRHSWVNEQSKMLLSFTQSLCLTTWLSLHQAQTFVLHATTFFSCSEIITNHDKDLHSLISCHLSGLALYCVRLSRAMRHDQVNSIGQYKL